MLDEQQGGGYRLVLLAADDVGIDKGLQVVVCMIVYLLRVKDIVDTT